jgi:hypothetical protein
MVPEYAPNGVISALIVGNSWILDEKQGDSSSFGGAGVALRNLPNENGR